MSRIHGQFEFAANFEVLTKAPLDARMVVETYVDLTTPATWEDSESLVWLYDGAIVAVSNDGDSSKNGLYFLNDAANYTLTTSWEQLGFSSGSTLNAVENIGSGFGVYSGISGTTILLRSIVGSGNTDVSISGDTLVVNSIDSTALQNGILRFDSNEQTFLPYTGFTTTLPSGIIFYSGTSCPCPTGTTRLALNARLTVTELRLSTGHTVSGVTHEPGDLYWDDVDSTITLHQTTNVKQQIGQELYVKVKNPSAGVILNGTVVYVSGSDSGRPTIVAARASDLDGDIVDEIIGMTTENIPAGATGFVTTSGLVRHIMTTGFTEGDIAYLSPIEAGAITATKPEYPDYIIEVGIITNVDAINGTILIKIINTSTVSSNVRGIETVNAGFTGSTRTDVVSAVGAGTYYLPITPKIGQQITILDKDGDAGGGWEIIINGNGQPINSKSSDTSPNYEAIINTNFGSITLLYIGGTSPNYGWRIINSNA